MRWDECSAIERITDKVSGALVFRGTRIPITALFENLVAGSTPQQFVKWFPGVTIEQVHEVIAFSQKKVQLR